MQQGAKDLAEQTFRKIQDLFLYHMKKLHQTFKSKRSIIMLTTVIRSLQYTLDVAIGSKMKIPDSDAIILFVNLYKLIFLGTKFTDKVL